MMHGLANPKFKFHQNITKIVGTVHKDQCTVMIQSCSNLPTMKKVSEKVVQRIKTHILCSVAFFLQYVPFIIECGKIW
jgi:hypothetical protein